MPQSETKSCPPAIDCAVDQKCNQVDDVCEACTGGYSGIDCTVPPPQPESEPQPIDEEDTAPVSAAKLHNNGPTIIIAMIAIIVIGFVA